MATDKKRFTSTLLKALAAGFLVYLLQPYSSLLLPALTTLGAYTAVRIAQRPRPRIAYIPRQALPAPDMPQGELSDAFEHLRAIETIGQSVERITVKAEVAQLHITGAKIVDFLKRHPQKISSAHKFLNYYLSTARNTLESYALFEASGLETEEVKRIRSSTEDALPILNQAFEEQFTKLMSNEIIDVEADLKLLQTDRTIDGGL